MALLRRLIFQFVHWLRYTRASELTRIDTYKGVEHGERVRITGKVNFGSEPFLIRLGSDITIADGVRFINHDGGARIFRKDYPGLHVYGSITVGSDVFIGVNVIILPNVTIGNRVVIGAGSVVTKDVPDGQVWAGIPAKFIKSTEDYKAGVLAKGTDWPVGAYGDAWERHLKDAYSDGAASDPVTLSRDH